MTEKDDKVAAPTSGLVGTVFNGKEWVAVRVVAFLPSPMTSSPDVIYFLTGDKTCTLMCQTLYDGKKSRFRLT